MKLYIIRHADAGNRTEWQGDDADRPLTPLGRRQARALGDALRQRGLAVDAVVASPTVRTRQTAEEFLDGSGLGLVIQYNELLAPGELRRRKLSKQLDGLGVENVAIVGHDPDLPAYLAWLVGVGVENVHLEKGGAALVTFEDSPAKGDGHLEWVVTPDWFLPPGPSEPTAV